MSVVGRRERVIVRGEGRKRLDGWMDEYTCGAMGGWWIWIWTMCFTQSPVKVRFKYNRWVSSNLCIQYPLSSVHSCTNNYSYTRVDLGSYARTWCRTYPDVEGGKSKEGFTSNFTPWDQI